MSYVIQNFNKINPVFRLTYRKYFYWLCRNSNRIINNFFYGGRVNYTFYLNTPIFTGFKLYSLQSTFHKSVQKHFSSRALRWKPLLENQSIRGFEYWSFKNPINLLINPSLRLKPISTTLLTNYFLNQHILESKYSKLPSRNKTYRYIFLNFTINLITPWYVSRPQYNFYINTILINPDWLILKRFNTRLFKVFFI